MIANRLKKIVLAASLTAMIAPDFVPMAMAEDMPAKQAFGGEALPVLAQQPQSIGFYAKGCLAGAVALPTDGPNWQVMRLSRNRRWGHPRMIGLLENCPATRQRMAGPACSSVTSRSRVAARC